MHVALGEVAPLAPAIPAALLGLLGLVAFLGYLVATGTLKVYAVSLGALIVRLADLLDFGITVLHRPIHPFGKISAGLRLLDQEIRDGLAELALEAEHGASWLFTQAGNIMAWTGREIGDLAETTLKALHLQRAVEIPRTFRLAVASSAARIRGIDDDLAGLRAQSKAQWARLRAGIDTLKHTITVTLPHRIAGVEAKVIHLPRDIARLGARVKTVEHKLGAKAFAGAVAIALTSIFGSWIRCGALRRVGRKVGCGGFGFLEGLLVLPMAALEVAFLCQYARVAQRVARAVVPELGVLLLVPDAVCLAGGASLPSAHDSPKTLTKITLPSAV